MTEQDKKLKVVMIGDTAVGKTALIRRWTSDNFDPNDQSTIGASFTLIDFRYKDESWKVQLWDTAGEEKFRSLIPVYLKGAVGAIIVFDMTQKPTFDAIPEWIESLQNEGEIPFTIVGNKSDLPNSAINVEEAIEYSTSVQTNFTLASALTGDGVDSAFRTAIEQAIDQRILDLEKENTPPPVVLEAPKPVKKAKPRC